MAKKATAKAEEIEQKATAEESPVVEAPKTEEQKAPVVEAPKIEEQKAPLVAAGDHFKTVKVRFKRTICADYGTFYQGEVGEIALYIANELEKCGAGVIVKE